MKSLPGQHDGNKKQFDAKKLLFFFFFGIFNSVYGVGRAGVLCRSKANGGEHLGFRHVVNDNYQGSGFDSSFSIRVLCRPHREPRVVILIEDPG